MKEIDLSNRARLHQDMAAWERSLQVSLAKLEEDLAEEVLRTVGLDLQAAVFDDTPKDTVRAAAGWILTTEPTNWEPPEGQDHYQKTEPDLPARLPSGELYLTNNVQYIQPLEFGHSRQAPQGMLRVNMSKTRLRLNRELRRALLKNWGQP